MKFGRVRVAQFQEQDCRLTLREALAEFYSVNSGVFSVPQPKTKWTAMLVNHDVSHVFFGVNTSILDEAAGDYWTLFATDLSFNEYLGYAKTPEAKKLIKDIGFINVVKSLIFSLPLVFKILFLSKNMTCKWKHEGYEKHMDTPLVDIRNQYNLKILTYDS